MSSKGLPDLIERHKGARSYVTLQRHGGGTPNATGWHDYHTGRRVPDPKNVPAVAAALHVSEQEVWEAMGLSLGYVTEPTAEHTPPLYAALNGVPVDMLTDTQVSALVIVVRDLVRVAIEH